MDFLTLFLLYLCSVLAVAALLCLCSGRQDSFLTRSVTRASQVLSLVIPSQLQRVAQRALHRLFHTRSCLFVVLHVALQAAVFGEYTWEVFVYCWELQFHLLLLLLPYLLLAANLGCFLLCSRANPGTVTKSNAASLAKVYAYDGVLFQRGLVCPTCTLEKPARSKHCSKDLRSLNNRGSKSFPKEFPPQELQWELFSYQLSAHRAGFAFLGSQVTAAFAHPCSWLGAVSLPVLRDNSGSGTAGNRNCHLSGPQIRIFCFTVTEPCNGLGWEGSLRAISCHPLPGQGHLPPPQGAPSPASLTGTLPGMRSPPALFII